MPKPDIKQILANNLRSLMQRSVDLSTQKALAKKAGISESHLSEILRCMSAATIELVDNLATALKVEPWELLAESETTRQAALAKLMWGGGVSDRDVEKHLPMPPQAPKREAAPAAKKWQSGRGKNPPPRAERE